MLNFYSAISAPMHEHESYEEQLETVEGIAQNLTQLDDSLDAAESRLEELENHHNLAATTIIEHKDKERDMSDSEKDKLFDEMVDEFMSKSNLMQRKVGVLKAKCDDLTKLTSELHFASDKIEALFIKDIQ